MSDDSNQAMATPPPPTFQPDNQGGAPSQGPVQQQGPPGTMPQTGPGPVGNMQGMPGQAGPMGGPTAQTGPMAGPTVPGQGGQGQGYQQGVTGGQPNPGNMEMLHKVCSLQHCQSEGV